MFCQFFVAPLFTASGTEREVNAVDSENSKNLVADGRRRLQILKDLCDPSHYYSKFTTGHAGTLSCKTEEEVARIRSALLDFHARHYSPDRLTVVVAGPQTLDELQGWMLPKLAPMTANAEGVDWDDAERLSETQKLVAEAAVDAPPIGYGEEAPPYRPALVARSNEDGGSMRWPFLLTTKPVRAVRQLELLFPVPSIEKVPDRSPTSVLSHLLGHEGPNSPFAVLQTEGLITSLAAGTRTSAPDFALFHVVVNLTEPGEERWREVADVIFQHARLVHEAARRALEGGGGGGAAAPSSELNRIWDESCELDRIMFRTTSPGSVYDLAPSLCRRIVMYGTEQCLSAGSHLNDKAETLPLEELADFSSRLVPSNCLIERCSPTAWEEIERLEKGERNEGDSADASVVERRTEPWYSVDYFLSSLSDASVKRWQGQAEPFFDASSLLRLPAPNRYIPRTLELCPDLPEEARQGPRIEKEIDPPVLLKETNDGHCRLWHRLDDRYALPKSVVTLLIRNAATENVLDDAGVWKHDTAAAVHSSLLAEMFSQAQAIDTYDADLAGLRWNLSLSSNGIKLTCSGFHDRLADLALQLMHDFLDRDSGFLQQSFFDSTQERIVRNLRTFFQARRADSIAMYYRDLLLTGQSDGMEAVLKAAEAASLDAVKAHHARLLQNDQSTMECLYTGNVSADEATKFFDAVSKRFREAFAIRFSNLSGKNVAWVPGDIERRLHAGNDVEFHFASDNPQEENGAVLATFQSPIPGFRGDGLSSEDSLTSSASIRLISHILREPLFDELRTKQTLGYIVSSYYDRIIANRPPEDASLGPMALPVDALVVVILSRKAAPPEVARRMDDFLVSFRESLKTMPESQIRHHATALSTKLLKPIQKLGTESATHFAKLTAFAPEVMFKDEGGVVATEEVASSSSSSSKVEIPWDSVKTLARKIEKLDRWHFVTIDFHD